MTPTAATHAIVISPGTKVVTVPAPPSLGMALSGDTSAANVPKYAVGLFDSNGSGPRKRKRLTHLTPEEKIMRRKLKNRVAAQTARDRKRLKMETLEETVQKVQQQAKELLDVNMKLLERAEALERENAELRERLGLGVHTNAALSGNRQIVERIKVEFDDTIAPMQAQHTVPDCMLSPDESADETDGRPSSSSSSDDISNNDANSFYFSASECASPKPAVFGEHEPERLVPLQQEAVNSSLIHSKAKTIVTAPLFAKETNKKMIFLVSSKASTLISKLGRRSSCQTQAKALDLTMRTTEA